MNAKIVREINLDFYNTDNVPVKAKQFDTLSRYILITCLNQGEVMSLSPDNIKAFIRYRKADENVVFNTCIITEEGKVLVELTQQMLAAPGNCVADVLLVDTTGLSSDKPEINAEGQIEIGEGSSTLSSMRFYVDVIENPYLNGEIESTPEFDALKELLDKALQDYSFVMKNAQASADAAKESAKQASTSEGNAKKSENAAKDAQTAAESAKGEAQTAAQSALSSQQAAEESASEALASQKASQTSQTEAAKSAEEALNSRKEAKKSQDAAKSSEDQSADYLAQMKEIRDSIDEQIIIELERLIRETYIPEIEGYVAEAGASRDSAAQSCADAEVYSSSAQHYYELTRTLSITNVGDITFSLDAERGCLTATFMDDDPETTPHDWYTRFLEFLEEYANNVKTQLIDATAQATSAKESADKAAKSLTDVQGVKGECDAVLAEMKELQTTATDEINAAKESALGEIGTAQEGALSAISEKEEAATSAISSAQKAATEEIGKAQTTATQAITDAQTTATSAIEELKSATEESCNQILEEVKSVQTETVESCTQLLNDTTTAKEAVDEALSQALTASSAAKTAQANAEQAASNAEQFMQETRQLSLSNVGDIVFAINAERKCLTATYEEPLE